MIINKMLFHIKFLKVNLQQQKQQKRTIQQNNGRNCSFKF